MGSFDLTGRLIEKFETQEMTATFRKREFVLETAEDRNGRKFFETIKFQLVQDKVEILDKHNVGDEVTVSFDIKGKRWERDGRVNYFTNLQAWRIEAGAGSSAQQSGEGVDADPGFPKADDAPPEIADDGYADDLPF